MISKDTLWKGIIEDLAEDFLLFFFPEYAHLMDFSQGFAFLDKELDDFLLAGENRNRRADKLFKVFLKDGQESWFLVHVEFQGYYDPDFPKRMFQMFYRIEEKYRRALTSVVLYTDTNRSGHFKEYSQSFMGTELIYRFNTFILMNNTPEQLANSENIFARVLEAAWQGIEIPQKKGFELLKTKLGLIKKLLEKGYPKGKVKKLVNFIKYFKQFESENFTILLEKQINLIIKSKTSMGITEAILNEVAEHAREEAISARDSIIVRNALKEGFSIEQIARLTDRSEEEIKEIIARIHEENS